MENMLATKVYSFTKNRTYDVCVSKDYLHAGDKVLFIDDFLANGEAVMGLLELCKQANASVEGVGIAIEKGFQNIFHVEESNEGIDCYRGYEWELIRIDLKAMADEYFSHKTND